jgi:hypothetical protein
MLPVLNCHPSYSNYIPRLGAKRKNVLYLILGIVKGPYLSSFFAAGIIVISYCNLLYLSLFTVAILVVYCTFFLILPRIS